MVYGRNFTQCVCTGYCESWILSLPSFIVNSCPRIHISLTLDIRRQSVLAVCRVIELSCPRQLVLKRPGGMEPGKFLIYVLFYYLESTNCKKLLFGFKFNICQLCILDFGQLTKLSHGHIPCYYSG